MKFLSTNLADAFVVVPDRIEDERGFFARSFCEREFAARNQTVSWVQCNISFNAARGTLRGLHFAAAPSHEAKLVRCTSGSIFDAIVDIRANSPTFGTWFAVELTQANRHALYIPSGFAHGFQTIGVAGVELQACVAVGQHVLLLAMEQEGALQGKQDVL